MRWLVRSSLLEGSKDAWPLTSGFSFTIHETSSLSVLPHPSPPSPPICPLCLSVFVPLS